jgi:hypothetical protein
MSEVVNPPSIKKWLPKFKREDYFTMIILASRNSGKTYLIKHLCRDYIRSKYDLFLVISDSDDTEADIGPVLPPERTTFLSDMDYGYIDKFKKNNAELKKQKKQPLSLLIIFDDKISTKQANSDDLLQRFTRGRHENLSVIFSTQAKKFANTAFYNNSDYVIVLKANSTQQKNNIVENILSGTVDHEFKTVGDERRYFTKVVREHMSNVGDALVIDSKKGTNNGLMWYRAP